jgi:hypothetical protein
VIGFEKNEDSAQFGTSSFGETRIWRVTHADKERNDMMVESLEMWREIEQKTSTKLLEDFPILNFGNPDSEFLKGIFSHFPDDKILTAKEMEELFPAMKNLPKNYVGMLTKESI